MCIAIPGVKAMFGCTRRCRQSLLSKTTNTNTYTYSDSDSSSRSEALSDNELPPQTPPKLTRREETSRGDAVTVASPPVLVSSSATRARVAAGSSSKAGVRRKPPGRHFMACARGDVEELSEWLAGPTGDADARDSEGWPLILHASFLLSRSANPDVENSLGETADKVSGAGPEAFLLLEEARRKKQARIAQWRALLSLHILWSSGRAVPKTPITVSPSLSAVDLSPKADGPKREAEPTPPPPRFEGNPSPGDEDTTVEKEKEIEVSKSVARADKAADGDFVGVQELRRQLENDIRSEGQSRGENEALVVVENRARTLESTVAGIAALPEEVFRRLVTFCTL